MQWHNYPMWHVTDDQERGEHSKLIKISCAADRHGFQKDISILETAITVYYKGQLRAISRRWLITNFNSTN